MGQYKSTKSSLDAGLGLIYRINTLFNKAEDAAMSGDFEKWSYILDRIFINLSYKGTMKYDYGYDDNANPISIVKIQLPDEDKLVFNKFKDLIRDIKKRMMICIRAKDRSGLSKLKEEHYETLMMKDIWLRKLMMDRGLYLKEYEYDPSKAMFGG